MSQTDAHHTLPAARGIPETREGSVRRRLGWRVAVLAVLALGVGTSVATAHASPVTFTFYGRGDGHGVGMSQYGAEGAARDGWSAQRILEWFYRGTSVTRVPTANIRVELAGYASSFGVGVSGSGDLENAATGARVALASGLTYTVRVHGAGMEVRSASGAVVMTAARVRVVPTGTGLVTFDGRPYRGSLALGASAGTIDAVNVVPIELYLLGVVPSEMPSSWAPAALQAQAIAARSYALRSLDPSAPFDVYDDQRSQVYGGVDAETASTDAAVRATAQEAVTYHGAVIEAFFASSDGGYTESVQNVWGGSPEPYLVGVPDPFDAIAPTHVWSDPPRFTGAQLGDLLGTGGTVTGIQVLQRGVSPRVMRARVDLSSGAHVDLTGNDIEAALGLESTWFWIGQSNEPAPAEPPIGGGTSGSTVARRVPAAASGSFLVVVLETPSAARARREESGLARIAPGRQIIARTPDGHRIYLVVAVRESTAAAARTARAELASLGYRAVVMRATKSDPAARPARLEMLVTTKIRSSGPSQPTARAAAAPAPAASGSGDLVPSGASVLSPGAAPAPAG